MLPKSNISLSNVGRLDIGAKAESGISFSEVKSCHDCWTLVSF